MGTNVCMLYLNRGGVQESGIRSKVDIHHTRAGRAGICGRKGGAYSHILGKEGGGEGEGEGKRGRVGNGCGQTDGVVRWWGGVGGVE